MFNIILLKTFIWITQVVIQHLECCFPRHQVTVARGTLTQPNRLQGWFHGLNLIPPNTTEYETCDLWPRAICKFMQMSHTEFHTYWMKWTERFTGHWWDQHSQEGPGRVNAVSGKGVWYGPEYDWGVRPVVRPCYATGWGGLKTILRAGSEVDYTRRHATPKAWLKTKTKCYQVIMRSWDSWWSRWK